MKASASWKRNRATTLVSPSSIPGTSGGDTRPYRRGVGSPWDSPPYDEDLPWIADPWQESHPDEVRYTDTDNPPGMTDMEQARLVRLALGTAIDREGINGEFLGGIGLPLYSEYMGPEYPGWDPDRESETRRMMDTELPQIVRSSLSHTLWLTMIWFRQERYWTPLGIRWSGDGGLAWATSCRCKYMLLKLEKSAWMSETPSIQHGRDLGSAPACLMRTKAGSSAPECEDVNSSFLFSRMAM